MLRRAAAAAWMAPILTSILIGCEGSPHSASTQLPRVLEFIENDWGRALAEAKSRKVPIFVEAWAPW